MTDGHSSSGKPSDAAPTVMSRKNRQGLGFCRNPLDGPIDGDAKPLRHRGRSSGIPSSRVSGTRVLRVDERRRLPASAFRSKLGPGNH